MQITTPNTQRSVICLNPATVHRRPRYQFAKRTLDVLVSLAGLLLLSPLFLLIIVGLKHEDWRAPIFYRATRIGQNGQPFTMFKFRSMVPGAEQRFHEVADQNEVGGAMFKMKNDPRVTPLGASLRKFSLDELPQLFNVLAGKMTLVGPRPPLPNEYQQYTCYDKQRLYVKPGCTGLWQVTKRSAADFDEMVALDLHYIETASIKMDLKIMFKTVAIVAKPNAAY
ncbi:sugar transferase [Levilactobacillus bambusae]|uniref:Multidrug MFS transporter n=1 Tax=Levilactobacillus bambusae TaxID=2024736 RepID=A0A2V1MYU4_9LACO|nr:sugar transferase [Levilactobacillus bambusae]PWF99657.1 multidrug MFS transporter [Levilactobacillus bambusae]